MIEDVKKLLDDYEDGTCTVTGFHNSVLSLANAYRRFLR
jgi:hypothetical protein